MKLTYPSQDQARRYRRKIQDAVQAVRKGETPDETALAWPAGLDRRLLVGLPTALRTRNCLLRAEVTAGDEPLTVQALLDINYLTERLVPDLLLTIDAFLDAFIETFAGVPNPAEVAAMRLHRQVGTMTPTEITCVEDRLLACPPAKVHKVALKLGIREGRVCTETFTAQDKARIALGAELAGIVSALTENLGPRPTEEVRQRIEELLDEVLPNDADSEGRRARGLFRRTLLEEMGLKPKRIGAEKKGKVTPRVQSGSPKEKTSQV